MLRKLFRQFSKSDFLIKWAIILLGTVSWSWTMVKSGWVYSYGMGFWGANGHDGIWHIALAENLAKGSFTMPVFSGNLLQNYHIGFDLVLGLISKLTTVPVVNLYFQVFPPILALFIGILTYKFVYNWTKSFSSAVWSTFFVYFGGSFGWVIGKGESAFWSQQAISSLINPPYALSLVILLVGLILLQKNKFFLAAIFFGILIEIKVYIGILALGSLGFIAIWKIFKEKKFVFLLTFFGALILSVLLYLPLNKNSQGLLIWQPFWFLETMMLPDRVGWPKFYSAMMTYKSGGIWIKGIPAYLVALIIFYLGNLGTRILKELLVWKWIKNFRSIGWTEIFSVLVIMGGLVIPMFFLQKGTPWNTIQFFYYSLFFSGILAGIAVSQIKNKFLLLTVMLLTLPTTILTLKDIYIPGRPPAKLSNEELGALKFLKSMPDGVVLTYPFDANLAKEAVANPPRPLYLYASTAYVSAFSAHPVFLEDEINLDITGYDWMRRRNGVESWLREKDAIKSRQFLSDNNIKYVYLLKGQKLALGDSQLGLKNIFENAGVVVYQVE